MIPQISKKSTENYIYPITLLLINFSLKIFFLDRNDIALDESFTIFYAQADLKTLFSMLKTENNPPFFFILIHYWVKVFGITAFSTRFLPLIFSTLTALFIYKIGKKFFDVNIALISSLIFTFSNYHIYYSHETRVYSLVALLTSISMYNFLSLIRNPNSRKYFILLILSNILLIYSHFFGFFVLFIQCICSISIKEVRNKTLKKYLLGIFITAIAYSPYLNIFISRFFISSTKGTWISPPTYESLYNIIWKFSNKPVSAVFFIVLLIISFIKAIYDKIKSRNTTSVYSLVILIWFLFPFVFMFLISFFVPMFLDRYLIYISMGFYLTLAISIDYLGVNKKIFYSISLVAVLLMIFTCNPNITNNRRKKDLVNKIIEYKKQKTIVYMCPKWTDLGFAYYYNIDYFKNYNLTRQKLNEENIFPVNNVDQIDILLLSNSENVIYLDGWAELVDKHNLIFKKLFKHFNNVEEIGQFHGFKLYYFSR